MSSEKQTVVVNNSGGIGFVGLLTLIFIVLKLTGVISWPWLWVLSPLWAGIVIWVLIVAFILGLYLVFGD